MDIPNHLVWATELSLAAISLVFPALVLGYNLFNCSMYQVLVPTLIGYYDDYILNSYYWVTAKIGLNGLDPDLDQYKYRINLK